MGLSSTCVSRSMLRGIAATVLAGAGTLAADRVYTPRDLPTDLTLFPALLVQTPIERKESLGDETSPQFNTTITLVVVARVEGANASQVETMLDQLCQQVEDALISAPGMLQVIQRYSHVETQMVVTGDGEEHVGQAAITLGCEVYQLYEPPPGVPLAGIAMTIDFTGPEGGTAELQAGVTFESGVTLFP